MTLTEYAIYTNILFETTVYFVAYLAEKSVYRKVGTWAACYEAYRKKPIFVMKPVGRSPCCLMTPISSHYLPISASVLIRSCAQATQESCTADCRAVIAERD